MVNILLIINTLRSTSLQLKNIGHISVDVATINVGNSAVTARCRIHGIEGDRLIKCYYRQKKNAPIIYGNNFYPKELPIISLSRHIEYVDVLIGEWVEGRTLDVVAMSPDCDFRALSRAFDRMAVRLLEADYAHGDIKPENIICRTDGEMQLIDMDAMWHSGIKESDLNEYGTPVFNHPKRPLMRLGKHIDDFPLALLSTILAAMALDKESFKGAFDTDNPLFVPTKIAYGTDETMLKAMTLLFMHKDTAHHAISTRLRCHCSIVKGLLGLLRQALSMDEEAKGECGGDGDMPEPQHTRCPMPRRSQRTWSINEDELLLIWLHEGHSPRTIAALLRRSESAVQRRITKLKIRKSRP